MENIDYGLFYKMSPNNTITETQTLYFALLYCKWHSSEKN